MKKTLQEIIDGYYVGKKVKLYYYVTQGIFHVLSLSHNDYHSLGNIEVVINSCYIYYDGDSMYLELLFNEVIVKANGITDSFNGIQIGIYEPLEIIE